MAKFKKLFPSNTTSPKNDNSSENTFDIVESINNSNEIELFEEVTQSFIQTDIDVIAPEKQSRHTEKIPVNQIKFANNNPFAVNDKSQQGQADFEALKESINSVGLIHNIVVNKVGNEYYVVSGERRLRAVRELNWEAVPCTVMEQLNNNVAQEMLFLANIDVRHYTPYEELTYVEQLSELYQQMLLDGRMTGAVRENIATKLNKSKRQVSKYIFINKHISYLNDSEIEALKKDEISINKAYMIIKDRLAIKEAEEPTVEQNDESGSEVVNMHDSIDEFDIMLPTKTENEINKRKFDKLPEVVISDVDIVIDDKKVPNGTSNKLVSYNLIDIISKRENLLKCRGKSNEGTYVGGYLFELDKQKYIVVNAQIKEQENSMKTTRISVTMFPVLEDTIELIEE